MKESNKHSKTKGTIGTIVIHAILLLLLFLFGYSHIMPKEEEGLTVNYGTSEMGSGLYEPAPQSEIEDQLVEEVSEDIPAETTPPETAEPVINEAAEELQTQDFEESIAAKEEREKKEKEEKELQKKKDAAQKIELEKKRIQKLERQKKLTEQRKIEETKRKKEAERKRIENEKRKKEEAIRQKTANQAKNAFGGGGKGTSNSQSEGINGGIGDQGNPFGDINSKNRTGGGSGNGSNYQLSGRKIQGKVPQPVYTQNVGGYIVVTIEVDNTGKVISARAGAKGTTIGSASMRKAAEQAALRAKFNGIKENIPQTGTITYHYNLK